MAAPSRPRPSPTHPLTAGRTPLQALKIDPTCRGAEAHVIHSNLSAVYAAMHEWTAALTHGQVCVSLKPDFAKGYARTGTALAHSGRQAEAVAHFERCLQLEPDNAAVRGTMRQGRVRVRVRVRARARVTARVRARVGTLTLTLTLTQPRPSPGARGDAPGAAHPRAHGRRSTAHDACSDGGERGGPGA